MSVFGEIDTVVKAASNIASKVDDNVSVTRYSSSISKGASKAIYYFPILISKNISPSTMGMISRNLEGSYMSFVKACFALTPAMSVKGSNIVNVEDYLKLFHQNIGLQDKDELMLTMREEAMMEYEMFPNDILNEANGDNINSIINRNKTLGTLQLTSRQDLKKGDDRSIINQSKILKETEATNSFRPSVVEIEVTFIIDGNPIKVNIPVGIKTMLHPVNPEDLLDHIKDSVSGKGILHNIIRYTTGELKSLTDILFGISKIKKQVKKSNDVQKWADALERRKNANRYITAIPKLSTKPYLPNMSIAISMEDVSEIEREVGYNLLTDMKRSIKFMKDNFLLSLVIADDVTETLYVLYDGHERFSEFPFTTVRRENDKTENIVNALIKGIGMGRTM